jgi:hypothetical protein
MANERQWDAVPPVLLISDGTTEGVLQVTDTAGFFFSMQATLVNNTPIQLTVYVKRVVDKNTLWVGLTKGGADHNVDLSAFTVTSGSRISAEMQNKSTVPTEARLQATYETDPIDAWRVRPVDPYGNGYSNSNPLPITFDGTVSIGDVSIVEGGNTMVVNPDGSVNVAPGPNYIYLIDSSVPNTTYVGEALPGSVASAAVWQIIKIVEISEMTSVLYANGSASFTNIWNNRTSLGYS